MKTIFKKLVVAAVVLSTTLSMANRPDVSFGRKNNAKSEVEKNIITLNSDPTFRKRGGKVLMNLLNLSEGTVIVKVIDSDGRIVYKEFIKGKMIVEKAFNFKNAYKDEYTVVVIDKLGTYKEKVQVK